MHMADALVSPAVGGVVWVVSGGLIALCARRVKRALHETLIPLMGVLGAFIFAAQMINFAIPGTGSSGHLGGGLILAILLGPDAAFLVMASVLTVQAFFFADGGLLALGCNMFNLGFLPAFVAYPLIYQPLVGTRRAGRRVWAATVLAALVGLQLGAFSVVLETRLAGLSELPFGTFVLMMQPIHLAIGLVEGLATVAVVSFVARVRPEILPTAPAAGTSEQMRPLLVGLAVMALLVGGVGSWFASTRPDGLEWAIARIVGKNQLPVQTGIGKDLAALQHTTAILPDYDFRTTHTATRIGTSVSGMIGGAVVLGLVGLAGVVLRKRRD